MTWSKEPPAVDGFYWIRADRESLNICEVIIRGAGSDRWNILVVGRDEFYGISEFRNAEWAGPIPRPT